MLIEKIVEFELREPGPCSRTCTVRVLLQLVILMTKQKSLRQIFKWIIMYR